MQQFPKKLILPMAAVAIAGAGFYGVATVSAATQDSTNPQGSLVQKLADTFKVDKSKVQAVFDEDRTAREADREKQYEARLTQAVTDGKLTEAQKKLVLAKHKELEAARKTAMETAKNDGTLSQADRKAAIDKQRTDIDAWAKANNIDAKWLMGGGMGGHGHGGPGGHGMMGGHGPDGDTDDSTAAPTATPSSSTAN